VRDLSERENQNILKLELDKMIKLESFSIKNTEKIIPEINKISSETFAKPAKVLNPFSSRFSFFFDFALLDFFNRTLAEPLGN
jgi:hypothetical protein